LGFQGVFWGRSEETLSTHYRGDLDDFFETYIIISTGGITRAHSHSPGGVKTPRGDIRASEVGSSVSIVTKISLEARALLLG
jgi:hypothetical protein